MPDALDSEKGSESVDGSAERSASGQDTGKMLQVIDSAGWQLAVAG